MIVQERIVDVVTEWGNKTDVVYRKRKKENKEKKKGRRKGAYKMDKENG